MVATTLLTRYGNAVQRRGIDPTRSAATPSVGINDDHLTVPYKQPPQTVRGHLFTLFNEKLSQVTLVRRQIKWFIHDGASDLHICRFVGPTRKSKHVGRTLMFDSSGCYSNMTHTWNLSEIIRVAGLTDSILRNFHKLRKY